MNRIRRSWLTWRQKRMAPQLRIRAAQAKADYNAWRDAYYYGVLAPDSEAATAIDADQAEAWLNNAWTQNSTKHAERKLAAEQQVDKAV